MGLRLDNPAAGSLLHRHMSLRIRKSILKRFYAIAYPSGHHIAKRDHLYWLLNHHNFVDRQLGAYGGFEGPQIDYLFGLVGGVVDTFVDIGANFGLYTLHAVARGAAREFIAFEPDPRNAAQLNGNLYLNGMTGSVVLFQKAVSERSGLIGLNLHSERSTGTTRVAQEGEAAIEVACVSLDETFAWRDRNILIKMDIEGHELAALRGMANLLTNNRCVLQVEVFPENRSAVDRFLSEIDYGMIHRIDSDFYYRRNR